MSMRNYSQVMRRWACLVAVAFTVTAAACGDPSSVGSPGDDTAAPNATSAADSTAVVSTPAADSTCPDFDARHPDFNADPTGMTDESSRLEPMLGQVLAYGNAHPDEFAGYGLIWQATNDATVVIALAGDVDAHRSALAQQVAFPDELVVCHAVQSQTAAQAMQQQLQTESGNGFLSSYVEIDGTVTIGLRAADERLAGQMVAQHGDLVRVQVGSLPYPMPDPPPPSHCPALAADAAPAGMEITVVPPGPLSAADDPFSADLQVMVRNVGSDRISFGTGIAIGYLLDQQGSVVAASDTVGIDDIGLGVDLAPGESTTIQLVVSPASCDPAVGYVVPPGTYQLVALVQHERDTLRSTPLSVEVTASG